MDLQTATPLKTREQAPLTVRRVDAIPVALPLANRATWVAGDAVIPGALSLSRIVPVAEESGVKICIHPDDPPFRLYGLPRVVSTASDVRAIFAAVDDDQVLDPARYIEMFVVVSAVVAGAYPQPVVSGTLGA